MKKWLSILVLVLSMEFVSAQNVYVTKNGNISFFSKTPLENIDASNNEVSSALNAQTAEIVFAVLIKGFHFERQLMEEHFNENYMESDKIPKSTFKGKIVDFSSVNLGKDGSYPVNAEGDLTLHGVTKKIEIPGTITVSGQQITATAKFKLDPKEYSIKIPSIVSDKIAAEITVSLNCKYDLKK